MVAVGTIVGGKYRLEAPVGEGGMATIWRAVHIHLDRPVAVKFVHTSLGEKQRNNERFFREARVAAAIRHRNVVDILDFGTTDHGDPFMVMELLEGQSLADRLVEGPPLTVANVVDIVAQSLSGLAAVHDAGIIHRDLKPENVFLVRDADGEFPKLLDFGVSRVVDPQLANRKSVMPTHENLIVGTPHYMSPEQARGLRTIDQRTDVYSMGVILYELLTGAFPFDSENPGDLIVMIATQDPVPVSALRPDLGPTLSEIVAKAMARDAERRFADARTMRDSLIEAAQEAGVAAGPVFTTGRFRIPPEALAAGGPSRSSHTPSAPLRDRGSLPTEGETPPGWEIASRSSIPDPVPRASRKRWVVAGAIVALGGTAAALIGTGVIQVGGSALPPAASAPTTAAAQEEPSEITVELEGVPSEATVEVDGQPTRQLPLVLPAGDGTYAIEVFRPGHVPWRVGHSAEHGGSYRVRLEPLPAAPTAAAVEAAPEPPAAPATKARAGLRRTQARGMPAGETAPPGVLRDLDF